jgi:hypothetical protein
VAPTLTVAPDPARLWPPDHRLQTVDLHPAVTDVCDPVPDLALLQASSSEPDDAPGLGDGATTGDIVTQPIHACGLVRLRAERAGGGPGRVYRLVCVTVDRSGNAATAGTVVVVPSSLPGP